jgi:hypothetical protein
LACAVFFSVEIENGSRPFPETSGEGRDPFSVSERYMTFDAYIQNLYINRYYVRNFIKSSFFFENEKRIGDFGAE